MKTRVYVEVSEQNTKNHYLYAVKTTYCFQNPES